MGMGLRMIKEKNKKFEKDMATIEFVNYLDIIEFRSMDQTIMLC
jgi:hypothetical protein